MKYALTGHTQGIGEGLYNRLSPSCIGFSKSTGYDITNKDDRNRIIDESFDCDVFINNACDSYGQTDLLLSMFDVWKDTNKMIINVGSRIAEIILPTDYLHLVEYQAHKQSLKATSNDLSHVECSLTVEYVWFAYVGTEKILQKYPDMTDYISIDAACDLILLNVDK